MTRTSRTRNQRREPQEKTPVSTESRFLNREEKRGLILAHAAARKPLQPRDRRTLLGGVIICALFILGAWATTVRSGITRLWAGSDTEDLTQVIEASRVLSDEIKDATTQGKTGLQTELERVQNLLQLEASKEGVRDVLRLQFTSDSVLSTSSTEEIVTEVTSTETNIEPTKE